MFKAIVLFLGLMLASIPLGMAQDVDWPREFGEEPNSVVLYQPQVESLNGNDLEARAAVSVRQGENEARKFGAIWIKAKLDIDPQTRIATIREIDITDVSFSDATDEERNQLSTFLEQQVETSSITISVDQVLAGLDTGSVDTTDGLSNNAPTILFSTEPAVLVSIDNDPILQDIENSSYQRVVNTAFLIVQDGSKFYLSGGGELWYESSAALGPWQATSNVPRDIAAMAQSDDTDTVDISNPPKIVVATVPSELVVAAGEPSWTPVEGMDLLYMDNTDSDVFLETSSQNYYIVLNGRWYSGAMVSDVLEWTNVPNDQLPEAFSDLDVESVNGHVLSSVSGTPQSREALLENSIPTTSAVKRDDSSVEVEYDGDPQFVDVESAPLQYAINTASSVFKVNDVYYVCDQGIWYDGFSATGPWQVATSVPDAIYQIPATNPHYNVTYVHVYDVTPEVVYVGYTPGYYGSYYYHGSIVYGTGYYYQPWYGRYYYPRPVTYGFRVTYNPYTGWGFGMSWSNGPFTFAIGTGGSYGRWGVGGYRPYPRPYVSNNYRKTNINIDNSNNINIGNGNGNGRPGNRPETRDNLYNRDGNRDRSVAQRPSTGQASSKVASARENNVFSDKNGNVYQRDNNSSNWQKRNDGQWNNSSNLDRSSISSSNARTAASNRSGQFGSSSAARPQLERDYSARQRGNQRTRQSQQRSSRSMGSGRRR